MMLVKTGDTKICASQSKRQVKWGGDIGVYKWGISR